mgnify:CR=1 FL=1
MRKNSPKDLWQRESKPDIRFAAATGRIRVLEEKMLSEEDFLHLADPHVSFSQRREILNKAGYSGEGSNEQVILQGRDKQDRLLYELSEGTNLATVLLMDLDYHNLKAIVRFLLLEQHEQQAAASRAQTQTESFVKEYQADIPPKLKPLIRETAPTSPELLFDVVVDLMRGETVDRPEELRPMFFDHIKEVTDIAGSGREMSAADLLADRLCFEEMLAEAEKTKQSSFRQFLLDYISIVADEENLESFLRVRRGHGSKDFLARALVPGGKVSPEELLALFDAEREELTALFQKSYVSAVMDPVPPYRDRADIRAFGIMKDEILMRLALLGKKAAAGGEAVLGFWLAKRLEMRKIRVILQAAGRGMRQEEIMPLIRPADKGYER